MSWRPFLRGFLRALFILYCIEAGVFLVLVPWREAWSQLLFGFPSQTVRQALLTSVGRGAVTGFGLIHLVWGAHDLQELLASRSAARQRTRDHKVP